MIESRVFKKVLTPAEVGNTGTHEKYIRLTNDFDFESFFQQSGTLNGTVRQIDFTAKDLTDGFENEDLLPFKFVFYENSNSEKRLPSLAPLYESHNVHEGDVIVLESRTENGITSFYFTLHKAGEVVLKPLTIFYTETIQEKQIVSNPISDNNLQQIFYGAPGTGKSHVVKGVTDTLPKKDVFRTTFHPDSDYSTFVGCYKPTMVNKEPIFTKGELINKLSNIKTSGVTYPCHKFAAQYWESLKIVSADDIKDILTSCGFTESMNVEVSKGIAIGQELTNKSDRKIIYSYVPQAFLKAYVRAYETKQPVYLVIEEINRGNCAQIFGDMFQLLDRNDKGESDYAIKPDTAIQEFLNEKLKDCDIEDDDIKSGEEMRLPANLHIWATMNTSDQSLFPIDSAFKRRWDWQYMPICKGRDENGNELNWKIATDTKEYDWWSFLTKINDHINSTTNSEDKKLGFFFCKPQDGCISSETFVGKVIFYLWNDVFKDFGFEGPIFKDTDGSELSFNKFYKTDDKGKAVVQKDKVELFLNNLGVDVVKDNLDSTEEREEDEDGNDISSPSTGRDYTKFSVNGVGSYGKNKLATECLKKYIELNPEKTADEVLREWMSLGNIVPHFIETKEQFDARTDNSKRSNGIPCEDTVLYVAHNGYGNNGKVQALIDAVNKKSWGITLSKA